MRPASPPVPPVGCYGPRLAFRCFWSAALAAVHPAPVAVANDGVLGGRTFAGFSEAPLTRPMGTEPRCLARFDQLLMVN